MSFQNQYNSLIYLFYGNIVSNIHIFSIFENFRTRFLNMWYWRKFGNLRTRFLNIGMFIIVLYRSKITIILLLTCFKAILLLIYIYSSPTPQRTLLGKSQILVLKLHILVCKIRTVHVIDHEASFYHDIATYQVSWFYL